MTKKRVQKIKSEAQVSHEIQAFLDEKEVFYWRNNTGVIPITHGGRTRIIHMGKSGMPDILMIVPGSFGQLGFIEVKKQGLSPTDKQKACIQRLRDLGAIGLVAYDIEDVESFLNRLIK